MENLILAYVMMSLLFLSLSVTRLVNARVMGSISRNGDTRLVSKKLSEKETTRCKLFAVWPALVLYEVWHLFKDR